METLAKPHTYTEKLYFSNLDKNRRMVEQYAKSLLDKLVGTGNTGIYRSPSASLHTEQYVYVKIKHKFQRKSAQKE